MQCYASCWLVSVHPSSCLSVFYPKNSKWLKNKYIIILLFERGSFLIPVSWGHPVLSSSRGIHSAGARNTQGWEIFAIFNWNHPLSRKRYEIGPWLLWNINRKSWITDQSVSILMTLSVLERWDAKGQFFRWISLIMLISFDLERPNLGG